MPTERPFGPALQARAAEDLEMWKFKLQLIDSFGLIDAALRGQVKQIVDFRDWTAHGWHTTHEPAPVSLEPDQAYQRLTRFLKAAGIVA